MNQRRKSRIDTTASEDLCTNPFGRLDAAPFGAVVQPSASSTPRTAAKTHAPASSKRGRVEVRREKAGRGGKTVTTLKAFATHVPLVELERLTFDLKKHCACGGTLKERTIELQGDVAAAVLPFLQQRGYAPVRAGG
jgi:translation initiation factor 1